MLTISLIGYGKMGQIIEQTALSRHHEIVCTIDQGEEYKYDSKAFLESDVAIEFSAPNSAVSNIHAAWQRHIPIVSGTTGWIEQLPILKEELQQNGETLFWSANYSIGVNLFFELNRYLAKLMKDYDYDISLEEIHHIHKLDAPSGTAIVLANDIKNIIPSKQAEIESKREGEVPGTHIVRYCSHADTIEIRHEAHSREGFALGAVIAAEYIAKQAKLGKHGFYTMNDLLKLQ